MTAVQDTIGIQGYVSKGFEAVRDAFLQNFLLRKELGFTGLIITDAMNMRGVTASNP